MEIDEASVAELALREFGKKLESKIVFSFKDQEEVIRTCGIAFEKIKELRKSRDNWKERYISLKILQSNETKNKKIEGK